MGRETETETESERGRRERLRRAELAGVNARGLTQC